MKKRKLLAVLLCLALLITVIAACKKDDEPASSSSGSEASPSASAPASPSASTDNVATSPDQGENIDISQGETGNERDTFAVAIDNDSGVLVPGKVTGGQYIALQSIYEPLWDIDEGSNMLYIL
ncbi:MAG: hypothetical protein FWG48_07050, partial [Oscillospiraceae bacterium]|nr:hypothetical protein [Oscillospiraceae bacterium]